MQELFYDTAMYQSQLSKNEFNEIVYSPGIQIKCRKVHSYELIITQSSEQVISRIKVYTIEKINENDLIDGKTVKKVVELKSLLDSTIYGYKSYLG